MKAGASHWTAEEEDVEELAQSAVFLAAQPQLEDRQGKGLPGWMTLYQLEVMRDSRLSLGARVTLGCIAGYVGENCKNPTPGREQLAREVGCKKLSTLDKYIKELVKAGRLKVERRRGKTRKDQTNS
jgi:hypothetical protein